MRNLFIFFLLCIFCQVVEAQLKKTVPITPPIKKPIAVKVAPTGVLTNNNSTTAPLTLIELNQKVADLETFVNNIYESRKIITVTANNANLFDENQSHQFPQNNVILRIDNPVCNNNPNAKIFYSPTSILLPALQAIYYEAPYWYARFYFMAPSNLGPYDIVSIHGVNLDGDILKARKFQDAGSYTDAIQLGSRVYLKPGDKFVFAIFTPIPLPKAIQIIPAMNRANLGN